MQRYLGNAWFPDCAYSYSENLRNFDALLEIPLFLVTFRSMLPMHVPPPLCQL